MGCLYSRDLVRIAEAEVGYQADGKWNKYAYDLDQVDFFTGCGKKQYLDYCSVFTSWCAYQAIRNENGEFDPDVWDAHYFLYQPDSNDCAAVVKYVVQYYKDHDAWYESYQDLSVGDQVCFQNDNGYSHTGWCVDWDDEGFWTVEGNTNGGKVAKKYYTYAAYPIGGYVAGFGRPRYDGKEFPTSEKTEEPVKEDPKPAPEPEKPTSEFMEYTVDVRDFLNIRTGPSSDNKKIGELKGGAIVRVYEKDGAWGRIGGNMWVCMDYLD